MNSPIYLDYNATTPVAPEVAAAMRPWIEDRFGSPSSSHVYGQRARQAVAQARESVAALIGALYVRRGTALKPILFGAGQEHGLRPGIENVARIVGAGETARLARDRLPHAMRHLATLRDDLHRRLAEGAMAPRLAIADV